MHSSFFGAGVMVALVSAGSAHAAAATDATASFSVSTTTEVPGAVLKPGAYTIHVVDHLSDRTIVRLDAVSGSTHVTFLGVNAAGTQHEAAHPIEWTGKNKGRHALRGFVFPNGSNVEFVYPKADAVALANANSASVVAIDPASEGRPELSKLTNQDMQMVNLWMLTPVRVGPGKGQKGIDAKHYQPTLVTAQNTAAPASTEPGQHSGTGSTPVSAATVSSTAGPARAGRGAATSSVATTTRDAARPAMQQAPTSSAMVARADLPARPASMRRTTTLNQLPQTASNLPLLWLTGALSIFGAGVLRSRRLLLG